jgi:Skp family chaperone for outer membrane proteins
MMVSSLPSFRPLRHAVMTVLAVGLLAVAGLPSEARAQDPFPNASIGIIDMQRILQDSSAAQGVDRDRQTYLESYNKETAAEEQALREEQRSLSLPPNQAPTPELQEKARAFREKVAAFEESVAERRRNLERALSKALGEVQRMITIVADEVAAERGINLVLYRSQVPLFDPRMEMTEDVLARLNERLPSVEFPDPANLPASGSGQ